MLRYADVEALASDPRMHSNALSLITNHFSEGPLVRWWRRMMVNLNGPEHTRLRSLVSRAFTPRAVDRERPRIRQLARELIERRADAGTLEVVNDFAHELPIRLICEMLGVSHNAHADFSRWTTDLGRVLSAVMTPELRRDGEEAVVQLSAYSERMIAERRLRPRDDLLTALIRASDETDEPVSDQDLITLVINLLFGGHDTSRSMLSIAISVLLRHPDQLEKLRANPDLMASAAEEILRYEPVIGWMFREPTVDLEVSGVPLPAGQTAVLSIQAAGRDPDVFTDPDRFDIAREGPRSFAFGWGSHHCLGAALARAELQEAIPTFFECCRDLELLVETPRWVPFVPTRRIESLPVRFRPS